MTVTTPGGASATTGAGNDFTYVPPAPTVAAVNAAVPYDSTGQAIALQPSGAFTSLTITTGPANGTVTVSGATATYIPNRGYVGTDSFTYAATGPGGTSGSAFVSLTVAAPPPPTATVESVNVPTSGAAGGPTPIDLSTAFLAASGLELVTPPQFGTVTFNGFVATYTPNPGYFGPDSFSVRAIGLPGNGSSSPTAALEEARLFCALSDASASSLGGGAPGYSGVVTVNISAKPPTLLMSPGDAPAASVGAAYSQTFAVSGGTAPYLDFQVAGGALPPGLTLSANGQLTGTPTATGTFGFTIAATDSSSGFGPFTASGVYSVAVGVPTVSLSPGSLSDGVSGAAYSPVTFAGQGGTAPYSFSLSAGSLPAGLTLSSAGLLSGTPNQSGSFNFTVQATDASGGGGPFISQRSLTLVISLPSAPVASSGALAAPFNSSGVGIDVAALVSGVYSNVALATGPANGSVAVSGTRFTYTPATGFYGTDRFTYTAAGLGGTSVPAEVLITVATPAPATTAKVATTLANAPVDIAVTNGDSGPITSIAISQAPRHGVAVVTGLVATYTPATNYFGPDSFSYTATGPGGTSAPAVVSLTVGALPVPAASARTASVVAGRSVVLDATTGATGGPFTAVALASSPAAGAATVSGQQITYAAPAGFSGSTSFTYTLSNAFGTSAPITASITVNPMPAPGAPITVIVPADGSGSAVLTSGASGGPFQSAAVMSVSPAGSGTVLVQQGSGPSGPTFTLNFTAARHFSGPVTVTYTLSNAFATSAPGTVIFQVQPRPDPSLDPDVSGLVGAQSDTAVRFATAQMGNFNQRLESLRTGPGRSDLTGMSLNFGDLIYRGDQSDQFALRDRQLGRQEADLAPWVVRPTSPADAAKGLRSDEGGKAGGGDGGGVNLWTAGTIDMGLRRSRAGLSELDFTTEGVSLGADFSLGERIVVGVGTGYSSDNTTIGTDGSRSKATSYVGVIYGAYQPSDTNYLEMVFGYGEMSFESRRFVPVNGLTAFGERDGRQMFASVTAAFEQRGDRLRWTPYGRVAVVSAELDAFTETGGGVGGLTFHRQDVRSVKGIAGLTSDYVTRTRYGVLKPLLRLEYAYEFEDGGSYSLEYADWAGGPVFTGRAEQLGRGRLTFGLGADLERGPLLLGIEYRGAVGSDEATSSQLGAKASLKF